MLRNGRAGGKAEGDLPTKCQPAVEGVIEQITRSFVVGELLCLRRFE